ncbi:Rieske 2Fe-2S domain-containing protein [Aquibacillus sediminis]|uniref:Rieske (2Fe-2S) protein n=1 Tax=Aquibacillus sediminis TaxID=2574734 RepID=UPI001108772A
MAELTGVRVCLIEELPPGHSRLLKMDKLEIAIFNVDGNLYAIRNQCPHQGTSLVHGAVSVRCCQVILMSLSMDVIMKSCNKDGN